MLDSLLKFYVAARAWKWARLKFPGLLQQYDRRKVRTEVCVQHDSLNSISFAADLPDKYHDLPWTPERCSWSDNNVHQGNLLVRALQPRARRMAAWPHSQANPSDSRRCSQEQRRIWDKSQVRWVAHSSGRDWRQPRRSHPRCPIIIWIQTWYLEAPY